MIKRYTHPEMGAIWSEQRRYETWLEVELAAADAMAAAGLVPAEAARDLRAKAGFDVASFETMVSPVNWTYSVRNALEDLNAPTWVVNQFSLSTPVTLGIFTAFDAVHTAFGRGALLRVVLRRPH